MPELPDISACIAALESRILSQPLERICIASVFLLRTADPPITAARGKASPRTGGRHASQIPLK